LPSSSILANETPSLLPPPLLMLFPMASYCPFQLTRRLYYEAVRVTGQLSRRCRWSFSIDSMSLPNCIMHELMMNAAPKHLLNHQHQNLESTSNRIRIVELTSIIRGCAIRIVALKACSCCCGSTIRIISKCKFITGINWPAG
jgi:hypothetical protein